MMKSDLRDVQRLICLRFGANFCVSDLKIKVRVSRNVRDGIRPLNGLRIRPEGDTSGWYIWAGNEFSEAPDFFVPLHASHLETLAPLVLPYLGLPPGWRFLVTEEYEDVWADAELIQNQ